MDITCVCDKAAAILYARDNISKYCGHEGHWHMAVQVCMRFNACELEFLGRALQFRIRTAESNER